MGDSVHARPDKRGLGNGSMNWHGVDRHCASGRWRVTASTHSQQHAREYIACSIFGATTSLLCKFHLDSCRVEGRIGGWGKGRWGQVGVQTGSPTPRSSLAQQSTSRTQPPPCRLPCRSQAGSTSLYRSSCERSTTSYRSCLYALAAYMPRCSR